MKWTKNELINLLKSVPLPGRQAQYRMAPSDRKEKEQAVTGVCRNSAVAIIILRYQNEWYILFSKRQINLSHHAGQISFIGGEYDGVIDKTLIDTVLRETKEEIGVELFRNEMVRLLTSLIIPTSCYRVFPFVFIVDRDLQFKINNQEIERLIWIPFTDILKVKPQRKAIDLQIEIPYFLLDGEEVWGATAMILCELKDMFR